MNNKTQNSLGKAIYIMCFYFIMSCNDGSKKNSDIENNSTSYQKSFISVKLPDRQTRLTIDSTEMKQNLDGYSILIYPENENCSDKIKKVGDYQDVFWIQIEVDARCDYLVKASFGSFKDFSEDNLKGSSGNTKNSDKETNSSDPKEGNSSDLELVTYTKDIKPIIEERCLECHIKGGLMEYIDFTDFDIIIDRKDQIITSIVNDNMPWRREPLEDNLKEIFKKWEENDFSKGDEENISANFLLNKNPANSLLDKYIYVAPVVSVSSKEIKEDDLNLGLVLKYSLTDEGKEMGFKTKVFLSPDYR